MGGEFLWKRFFAFDEMKEVAVAIFKENQAIALRGGGLGQEPDVFRLQVRESLVEVIHCYCQMPNTRSLEDRFGSLAFARDNFQQAAIGRSYKVIAVVLEVDTKLKVIDIPGGKLSRIRRRDSGMFQTFEH